MNTPKSTWLLFLVTGVLPLLLSCNGASRQSTNDAGNLTVQPTPHVEPTIHESPTPIEAAWPGPDGLYKQALDGDPAGREKLQWNALRAELGEVIRALYIAQGHLPTDVDVILKSGLLFIWPDAPAQNSASPADSRVDTPLAVEGTNLLVRVLGWDTKTYDMAQIERRVSTSGELQNFSDGDQLAPRLREEFGTGALSEQAAAGKLIIESSRLIERRQSAAMTTARIVLVNYAQAHGTLPATFDEALSFMGVRWDPSGASTPYKSAEPLALSIKGDASGRYCQFSLPTEIGATYIEFCELHYRSDWKTWVISTVDADKVASLGALDWSRTLLAPIAE